MARRPATLAAVIGVACAVLGCGQKGPLTLPAHAGAAASAPSARAGQGSVPLPAPPASAVR